MRPASFAEAVGVAVLGAILAGASFHLGRLVLPPYEASRTMILTVGLCYACYLLWRSPRRDGRVLGLSLWLAATGLTLVLDPPVLFYLLSQLLMFWLIRALCHHRRFIHAVADGVIGALSLATTLWAFAATGSVFLACWCALLSQALFTLLSHGEAAAELRCDELSARFDRARRGAELALRRVSTTP